MPVPRPVSLILPTYTAHKSKRKVVEEVAAITSALVIRHSSLETVEQEQETVDEFSSGDCDRDAGQVAVTGLTNTNPSGDLTIRSVVETMFCEPPPPPPVKPKEEQKCRKHSRCHCNLLSIKTEDFFTIKV